MQILSLQPQRVYNQVNVPYQYYDFVTIYLGALFSLFDFKTIVYNMVGPVQVKLEVTR